MTDHDRSAVVPEGHAPSRAPEPVRQNRDEPSSGGKRPSRWTSAPKPNGQRKRRPQTYAALDLGTNNCRLLIARPTESGFRVLDGFSRIVRLGEGLSQTGRLSTAAMDRTIEALKICSTKLAQHDGVKARIIATEACRSADNSAAFLARVKREIGLEFEVIDRKTEAELAVTGCADLIETDSPGAILFDIGGGSSELAWLDFRGGRPRNQGKTAASIRSWQSLPVGVVSIAEKFGGVDVTPEIFEAMVAHVGSQLRHFRGRDKLREMLGAHPVHFLGTSGTVTTLAGLYLGLERYERSKVDGLWMQAADVDATMRVLLAMSYEKRMANPCIGRERADLVIPGCAIFEAIRREWPCTRIRVADRGLREGILISLMSDDRVWMRGRPARKRQGGRNAK
ncbi:Ppx/GppA phosphatase family protein [Pelagibacterium luteolum]|uniref:Exopolyphosphatase / guanosine-5'-triphosphate,3'-diphosphate pyrophosphatase n=1 Tax=Pelagibacterium luteolum TaxID=440168 RepID=A0A1G7ZJ11_9HYPH|nr:Ppx/GppA phosphatase family protein [Pelagibacterium luteolum]SDH08742.1 exopolyphosphatase / guanosine-5'-triphosphate,3'-diphosphate pyrophosphatase [Pelagibacterium luteolum]